MLGLKTIDGEFIDRVPNPFRHAKSSREIVKSYLPGPVWFIFNVTFISFYQSILLFAFSCIPGYVILLSTQFDPNVTAADIGYFVLELAVLIYETIGDEQQWGTPQLRHTDMSTRANCSQRFKPSSTSTTRTQRCQRV